MPMRKFEVHNLPYTCYERDLSDDSSIPSSSPSTESGQSRSSKKAFNSRRRRRGLKAEKKVQSPPHDKPMTKNDIYFALDCEMVGVGPDGLNSAVARVTICNYAEEVVLDTFVQVPVEVKDYRTFVSGITAEDLRCENALPVMEVRNRVKKILHGKILVGHGLMNDLAALRITHPWHDIRDSATYAPFMREFRETETDRFVFRPRKLKEVVKDRLGKIIQKEGKSHSPVEDARAAMSLYKIERPQWEAAVVKQVAVARDLESREGASYGREPQPPQPFYPYQEQSKMPIRQGHPESPPNYQQYRRNFANPNVGNMNLFTNNQHVYPYGHTM